MERAEFGANTHSGVFSYLSEPVNIDDCVCSLQEWLERGRIGISKNTYINLPTTLPSFCWIKQYCVVERTGFGATTF